MKSIILVCAVMTSAIGALASDFQSRRAAADPALLDTLTHLEKASWAAWQKRDGIFFQTFLSSDHVEVGLGGPTTKAIVVAGVASPSCVVTTYAVDRFALTAFNAETAVLTYHAQQETTCNGVRVPSPVWTSSVYIKRAGRWQNALYQQTPATK